MAAIKNSISMQDRMTPVFRSIIKSMDSTLRVMRNLDKQANNGAQSKAYQRAQRDIARANNELVKMRNHLDRADKAAGNLANTTNKVSSNMIRMGSGGFNLTNLASGLYLLKNIASTLTSIMETPDTLNALQYRLGTYDTTGASASQLFDASYLAAMRSRSSVESTASLASRILVSGATNGNGAAAIDLAELLNKAAFLGGSSSAESQRALLQLAQALSSGVLQGDELRAIREQAPGLTDMLARGLSSLAERGALPEHFIGTTVGDLKALGAAGELTSDRILAAFSEMSDTINTQFEESPRQFGQAVEGIKNVWSRWLKLMSQGDNALAKINDRLWDMLDSLSSGGADGILASFSGVVNGIVNGAFMIIDGIGGVIEWFRNLENSSLILQATLITLAVVAAGAAIYFLAAWISAAWPLFLIAAVLGIIIYALLEVGYTVNEVVGGIIGAVAFLGVLIWDIVVVCVLIVYWAVALIWDAIAILAGVIVGLIIGLGTIIILILQGIVQVVMWVILAIWSAILTIWNVIYTIGKAIWGFLKGIILGIYEFFAGVAIGIIDWLTVLVEAFDAVNGTDYASGLRSASRAISDSVDDVSEALDPLKDFEDIGNQWTVSYEQLGETWTSDDWFIGDNMADVATGGWSALTDVPSATGDLMLDPTMLDSWAMDGMFNPMDGWDAGYSFGDDLVDGMSAMNFDMGFDQGAIDDLMNNGMTVNGGDLDSVGYIQSDVEISDEDLKLLRDVAARDFLLNLRTVTPQANVTFGDVRETADVNKILDVIQDMVDEELATSLVVE